MNIQERIREILVSEKLSNTNTSNDVFTEQLLLASNQSQPPEPTRPDVPDQ
jgi:hypothetical protein